MNDISRSFRQVPIGTSVPNAVTVGIESDGTAGYKAAVWWDAVGDVDADEADFIGVAAALDAAEGARVLHGFAEIVVTLQEGVVWQEGWGHLQPIASGNEPIGDVSGAGLSDEEAFDLAAGLETQSDA